MSNDEDMAEKAAAKADAKADERTPIQQAGDLQVSAMIMTLQKQRDRAMMEEIGLNAQLATERNRANVAEAKLKEAATEIASLKAEIKAVHDARSANGRVKKVAGPSAGAH